MNSAEAMKTAPVLRRLVMEAVRKEVGPQFPIIVRISADEFLKGGNTLEDSLKLAGILP